MLLNCVLFCIVGCFLRSFRFIVPLCLFSFLFPVLCLFLSFVITHSKCRSALIALEKGISELASVFVFRFCFVCFGFLCWCCFSLLFIFFLFPCAWFWGCLVLVCMEFSGVYFSIFCRCFQSDLFPRCCCFPRLDIDLTFRDLSSVFLAFPPTPPPPPPPTQHFTCTLFFP